MLFNSYPFILIFLPITLLGYYGLSRISHRLGAGWLVAASFAFYAYWDARFLALLVASIAYNYTIARLIFANTGRTKTQSALLALGVSGDIAALCYFKYLFAIFSFLRLHTGVDVPFPQVILPLGISFFTFTQIGYLVDVRQGLAKDRNLLDYLLFVTFFPHLIAGPILHNREMMPQFASPAIYRFSGTDFALGLTIFAIGLAKKVLIADYLVDSVHAGFDNPADIMALRAWYAAICYSFQLYFDFSGYSDMAIGLARMFNVKFPLNFNSPFKATSVIDYWQRFHMTLTRYTTMYVFSPIAMAMTRWWMKRNPQLKMPANSTPSGFALLVAFPAIVTMTLLGVWHGAGLQYLVFGLLHGIYITVNHASRIFLTGKGGPAPPGGPVAVFLRQAPKVAATTLAVLLAQVFFRSSSVESALQMLGAMTFLHNLHPSPTATVESLTFLSVAAKVLVVYVFLWVAPNTQQITKAFVPALANFKSYPETRLRWSISVPWMLAVGALLGSSLARLGSHSEFLYFQF